MLPRPLTIDLPTQKDHQGIFHAYRLNAQDSFKQGGSPIHGRCIMDVPPRTPDSSPVPTGLKSVDEYFKTSVSSSRSLRKTGCQRLGDLKTASDALHIQSTGVSKNRRPLQQQQPSREDFDSQLSSALLILSKQEPRHSLLGERDCSARRAHLPGADHLIHALESVNITPQAGVLLPIHTYRFPCASLRLLNDGARL
jgi:hypothetical protein